MYNMPVMGSYFFESKAVASLVLWKEWCIHFGSTCDAAILTVGIIDKWRFLDW